MSVVSNTSNILDEMREIDPAVCCCNERETQSAACAMLMTPLHLVPSRFAAAASHHPSNMSMVNIDLRLTLLTVRSAQQRE